MRTPHSSTNKGKKVKITTRTGGIYVGKFKDKKSGKIVIEDCSVYLGYGHEVPGAFKGWQVLPNGALKFHMKDVRAFSIYKPTCTQTK